MFLLRIASAIGLVFLIYQLAQEPENIDNLSSFSKDSFNDLFAWGENKFVLGNSDINKNGTKRKKSYHETFMEAIMEGEEEETK
jgi:hypothetical protein